MTHDCNELECILPPWTDPNKIQLGGSRGLQGLQPKWIKTSYRVCAMFDSGQTDWRTWQNKTSGISCLLQDVRRMCGSVKTTLRCINLFNKPNCLKTLVKYFDTIYNVHVFWNVSINHIKEKNTGWVLLSN